MEVVKRMKVRPVLDAFEARLAGCEWGFYGVRRIYTTKRMAVRCVERLAKGTREEMTARFDAKVNAEGLTADEARGTKYGMFARRVPDTYPTTEGFYVVAPGFVGTKVRGPVERFNERFDRVNAGKTETAELPLAA